MAEESKTTHDRAAGRVERVAAILRSHLEDEAAILEVLLAEAVRGRAQAELWNDLHQAAVRDDMLPELAFAYEQLARSKKLKAAPPPIQAEVLMHAASFFVESFGDGDGATDYLERVLEIDPDHPTAFAHLERLLVGSKSWDELSSLYLRTAAKRQQPREKIALLRRAAELFDRLPGEVDRAIRIYEEILRIDAGQRRFRRTLEARYLLAGRTTEAAAFLEKVLSGDPPPDEDEAFAMRTRLMVLYAGELGDVTHALPHVEELLRRDPAHEQARVVAERLLGDPGSASRAAAALADAWERLGSAGDAAAMLETYLENAEAPERSAVERRLAILKHDAQEHAVAMPLLEALLLSDPSDDEVRKRFTDASAALDRRLEAARTLARAAGLTKDLGLRARIGTELGTLLVEAGDKKRARAVFQEVLDRGGDDHSRVAAARALAALYAEAREYRPLAAALEVVARSDPDPEARLEATERLAAVTESALSDTEGAIHAWRRLIGTPREPTALAALEKLYERAGSDEELAETLERRARGSGGVASRVAAFRAAEIRSRRLPRPGAIDTWRRFLSTYGPARDAHACLIALLDHEDDHEELAQLLAQDAALAPPEERAQLLARAGSLRAEHGQDARATIEALREVLRLDPSREDARRRLVDLVQAGEYRLAAAQVLEPAARAARDARALFVALEARAELAPEAGARMSALEHASALAEREFGDPRKALELAGCALAEAAAHEPRRLTVWLDRTEKLATAVKDPVLRATLLKAALGDRSVDSRGLARLARSAGEALETAGQFEDAISAYRRVLAFESSGELEKRVKRLVAEVKTPEERIRALETALADAPDVGRRRALRRELGALLRELRDHAGSVRVLEAVLDDDADDAPSVEALATTLGAALSANPSAAATLARTVKRTAGALEALGRLQAALDLAERAAPAPRAPIELVVIYFALLMRKAEETLGDRAAAVAHVASHVLGQPERQMDAPLAIALMLPKAPDLAGTLAALEALRGRSEGAVRIAIDLVVAEVLLDRAEQPVEALQRLERVLAERPDESGALPILERALALPAARARAAELLDRALPLVGDEQRALALLERIADATQPGGAADGEGTPVDHDTSDATARAAWFEALLDRLSARPEIALAAAVRAVRELPDRDALWDRAESLARSIGRSDAVADAYRRVLETPAEAPYVAHLGRRAVAFQEEWSDRPEAVVETLRALLAVDPAWAFDRLKLVLSSSGRYDELFDLYDRAIGSAKTDGERVRMLEEAVQLAKDFASDVARAIGYLEALAALRPEDTRLDMALERLYERAHRTRDLIDLLARRVTRLDAAATPDATAAVRLELLARVASLWLELGEEPEALARVEQMLAIDAASEAAFERLARIVLAPLTPPDAPTEEIPGARKRLPLSDLRRAAARLKARFASLDRMSDVARAASVELDTATSDGERLEAHAELLELTTALGQHATAFDHAAALLDLDPRGEGRVARLAEIAGRIERSDRLAEVLESVATRTADVLTSATLHREAARVQAQLLSAADRAAVLYERAMELVRTDAPSTRPRDPSSRPSRPPSAGYGVGFVLATARELLPLYGRPGKELERCDVLETIAALEPEREARRAAYGEAATLAAGPLGDLDRAVRAYRARLGDDGSDREALHGLCEVLERAGRFRELVDALERRAEAAAALGREGVAPARADRVRVAGVHEKELASIPDAIEAWRRVRSMHGIDDESYEALMRLLEHQGRHGEQCDLLSEEAASARDPARKVALLSRLGRLAHRTTRDPERATAAFREALSLDPSAEDALAGATALLDVPSVRGESIDALARAVVETGAWARGADLASALAPGEDVPEAVARRFWWGVALHHRDVRKDAALAEWALGRALSHDPTSAEILTSLAAVQRAHPGRPLVESLVRLSDVSGGDLDLLREAAEVALGALDDPAEGTAMCERLLDLAIARWNASKKEAPRKKKGAEDDARSPRAMAAWALDELIRVGAERSEWSRVVELHLRWAELPFERPLARGRRLTAARLAADRLGDTEAAIRIHRTLIDEEATDDVARESVSRLADLLLTRGETLEVAQLWEDQAKIREQREEERGAAAELWARAAELCETKLGDVERALGDHEAGARLGGRASLSALARLRTARGEHAAAATALEALCAQLQGESLGAHVLLLADALALAGDAEGARDRLRRASESLADPGRVRARLAELYREVSAWDELAALETQEAERMKGAERLKHLRDAAEIHLFSRKSPVDAVPLLEAARALDPDDATLGLLCAESLLAVGRHRPAMRAAADAVARYGARRPKERALCHYALARAARAAGETSVALSELDAAAKMDAAHPGILHALGRLAVELNEVDRAARAYQALLLIRGPADVGPARRLHDSLVDLSLRPGELRDGEFGRAELLLELADLSDRRGDVVRGAEFRESAAAAARETPDEAARYERAASKRKKT